MSEVENTLTVVLWEAKAKPGREAEMKAFLTSAVTPSRPVAPLGRGRGD